MAAGNIPVSSIPNWPNPPEGLMPACQKSLDDAKINGALFISPQGLHTPDVANTTAVLNSYVGGATELTYAKDTRKKALFDLVDGYYLKRCVAYKFSAGDFLTTLRHFIANYRRGSPAGRTAEAKRPVIAASGVRQDQTQSPTSRL